MSEVTGNGHSVQDFKEAQSRLSLHVCYANSLSGNMIIVLMFNSMDILQK